MAALLVILAIVGCASDDSGSPMPPADGKVAVELALCVSPSQSKGGITRMSSTIIQADNNFRGIQDLKLIPLNSEGNLAGSMLQGLERVGTTYHYFSNHITELSIGTSRFLCYAKAKHDEDPNPAINGILNATFPTSLSDAGLSAISFTPCQISPSGDITSDDYLVARNLAAYLKSIATAGDWASYTKLNVLYAPFTGNGNLIAGSSANVKALVNKLYQQVYGLAIPEANTDGQAAKASILAAIINDVTTNGATGADLIITSLNGTSTTREGYPGNIGLPDGAAAMKWVATKPTDATDNDYPKFVPQVKVPAGSTMPLSDHERFAYPPELYYYINSPIKTSESSKESAYVNIKWEDEEGDDGVLNKYEHDDATVASTTRSVAVKNPLDYAVGCLVTTIQAASTELEDNSQAAKDAEGIGSEIVVAPVSVSGVLFPLTGIQIDGQYKQTYEFLPVADTKNSDNTINKATEYIVYDKDISGVYLTPTLSGPAYTLAYQSRDGKPVDIVLEFLNNSGKLFYGYQNGIVYPGTKFYLIGQIWPPNVDAPTESINCRVFTKDYISSVQLTIQSLQNAYNVIPDLKTAQYAIKVANVAIKSWVDAGIKSSELYNW